MERKGVRIATKEKLKYARLCYEGKMSFAEAGRKLSVDGDRIAELTYLYEAHGEEAFKDTGKNNVYTDELRKEAVLSYLKGEGSYRRVAAKYGLRSSRQLRRWVKMYNSGEDFSHKMSGGSRMKTSRTTTKEERIRIVRECIANGNNYGECAMKYNVSYQQVYTWVKRFRELGEKGLEDRRGRRKDKQEPRSEVEELQIRMAQLEHELYMTRMERDLLKKVRELERKDIYHK